MTEQSKYFDVDQKNRTWTVKRAENAHSMDLLVNGDKACEDMLETLENAGLLHSKDVLEGTSARKLLYPILIETMCNSMEATDSYKAQNNDALYTPEINLRVTLEDQLLWISVIDNGTGFPQELLDKVGNEPIISPKKGLPAGTHLGGRGQYLYVTRKIIEPLGWKIQMRNREDQHGAIVSIGIPLEN